MKRALMAVTFVLLTGTVLHAKEAFRRFATGLFAGWRCLHQ